MNNFLANLAARNSNQMEVIQPRLPSLFEPWLVDNHSLHHEQGAQTHGFESSGDEWNFNEAPASFSTVASTTEHQAGTSITEDRVNMATSNSHHTRERKVQPLIRENKQNPASGNATTHIDIQSPSKDQARLFVRTRILQPQEKPHQNLPQRQTGLTPLTNSPEFSSSASLQDQENKPSSLTPHETSQNHPVSIPVVAQPKVALHFDRPTSRNEEQGMALPEAPPAINVTIGRIEVRATTSTTPISKPKSTPKTMSLDDYLRQRSGGGKP